MTPTRTDSPPPLRLLERLPRHRAPAPAPTAQPWWARWLALPGLIKR